MTRKRKRHSAELKAKVALEAIKGQETASQLSGKYGVHPVQISQWKRHLLDHVAEVFAPGSRTACADEKLQADLYEQIGRLKMELEWLKKKASRLG